ncbi:hypothetical protein AVEN_68326-1 [Araneus ventricosus]|uniref:Uncharacterized protein n=1 Tax=Araneus ventricosus TaxID=182803 RepID=A0A4Y2GIT8_ARAVE|nr:hypothetical protein AVEN_68326-1 [Araneus ventricosus]
MFINGQATEGMRMTKLLSFDFNRERASVPQMDRWGIFPEYLRRYENLKGPFIFYLSGYVYNRRTVPPTGLLNSADAYTSMDNFPLSYSKSDLVGKSQFKQK